MVMLAVDYGDVRTGIAVCDKNEILASPVCVITERSREALVEKVHRLAVEKEAECLVVGLPKNMDGTEGFRAEACKAFADVLQQACGDIFARTDILRIFAEPFSYNAASCRVLEKAGFQYEGTLRSNAVKNGKVLDMKMYSKLRPEICI